MAFEVDERDGYLEPFDMFHRLALVRFNDAEEQSGWCP